MRAFSFLLAATVSGVLLLPLALSSGGCDTKQPTQTSYFQRTVAPILATSCVRTNTGAGCHVADDKGDALGNLDVASFDGLNHRRDLLLDYGPYGQPAFLVKNVPPFQIQIQSFDGQKVTVTTDIKHVGGPILDPTASAYQTLRRYLENGATENNSGTPPPNLQRQPCTPEILGAPGFDPNVNPGRADFETFKRLVNPIIQSTCSASNCHGTSSNDLYLTCGADEKQLRWNYFAASEYLAQTPEQSEIARRPLSPAQGGSFHEGGAIFATAQDEGYKSFIQWATEHGAPQLGTLDPNFQYFAHKVQPMLAKKGCMMVQCHSAAMFHDYRLRGGSGGSFSLSATRRNYNLTLAQVSLESDDPNASRLVRKNLYRPELFAGSPGLAHRGGPLLEDFQGELATGALCDKTPFDYDNGDLDKIPPYCVIRDWLKRERGARSLAPLSAIVYVKRPPSGPADRAQDFDVFAGGAELHIAKATQNAAGDVVLGADAKVDLAGCGLGGQPDVRRPAVSWDAKTIAFAASPSAGTPLNIYTVNADGSGCAKHADINAAPSPQNDLAIHNFDPAWSPPRPDGKVDLVFASTRGNLDGAPYDYPAGPARTPADPSKANANLYVYEPDPRNPATTRIRQLTFQLNLERYPSFMSDGRLVFTVEKRQQHFYQLALRRQNLDGGDYHPLFAQRRTIGYEQATHVVELSDKNFAAIFSDRKAPHAGGALGVINRSIGLDFSSPDKAAYPIDPGVIDPASPNAPDPSFFVHSLRFPDGSASGRPGATSGLYTSPAALPGGKVLVSFGASATVEGFGGDYDVYVLDPATGAKTKLFGDAGAAEIEAVAVYGRAAKGIYTSTLDEPNGNTKIQEGGGEADVTVLDFPVLATLLFQNTPTGRVLDPDLRSFDIYEDLPPPLSMKSFPGSDPNVVTDEIGPVYVRRRLLGKVPLSSDGSAHFQIPGGLPILLRLPDTPLGAKQNRPSFQRETMTFMPNEHAHQSFRRDFFSGLCGQCHGSVSGRPLDIAVQPDILTQASNVIARNPTPTPLNLPPAQRGSFEGPLPQ